MYWEKPEAIYPSLDVRRRPKAKRKNGKDYRRRKNQQIRHPSESERRWSLEGERASEKRGEREGAPPLSLS